MLGSHIQTGGLDVAAQLGEAKFTRGNAKAIHCGEKKSVADPNQTAKVKTRRQTPFVFHRACTSSGVFQGFTLEIYSQLENKLMILKVLEMCPHVIFGGE